MGAHAGGMKSVKGAKSTRAICAIGSRRVVPGSKTRIRLDSRFLLLAAVALGTFAVAACDSRDALLEELKRLELSDYEERDLDKKTESELLRGIKFLEDEVARTVDAGTHLQTYYKLVAIEYRARKMYGLAAEFYERALEISPDNHILAYWSGVSFAQVARALTGDTREVPLGKARHYYEQAVEIEPIYVDALYALSVLLVFEYDDLERAQPLLERILLIEERNFRSMFLLARIFVIDGRIDEAVELYSRVIDDSADQTMVEEARRNRNELLGGARGN